MKLNLANDIKDNKKSLCKYISSKKNVMENVGLLLNQMGVLVPEDTGQEGLLYAFFVSAFTAEAGSQESKTSELREECWEKEDFAMVEKGWELRELADTTVKILSIIFGK